jgi:hypothetical protein
MMLDSLSQQRFLCLSRMYGLICKNGLKESGSESLWDPIINGVIKFSRPQTREELFNLRHAQACNVIERIFGVIKNRWRILVVPPAYNMKLQARIPAALAALHNFILNNDPEDHIDPEIRDPTPGAAVDPDEVARVHGELATEHSSSMETEAGKHLRDQIADAMWVDYQQILAECGDDGLDEDEGEGKGKEANSCNQGGYDSAMDGSQDDEDDEEMDIDI